MEKDNRDGSEVIGVASADSGVGRESERTGENGRGDQGDSRRDRDNRRRGKLKLRRRKQRDGESRDSDDTARDASARADAGADAENTEEHDAENFVRVKQYSSESKKSKSRKESSPKKPIKIEDAIEQFLDTAFSIVSLLSGEPHWALAPDEREMLSDAIVDYIEAQDKKTLQRLRKVAGKYFPAINLAVVSFAIVYPRVLQSKIFLKKV